jgi:transposase
MGQNFRTGDSPDQAMLMPADPREWLPPGHLAWRVTELAREMDLSRFGALYRPDGQGGRPYHPEMMATLLLYSCCRGRKPSREIEMATFDDVGARIICGGLHPGHSTVAEFVRRNMDAVLALLPEPVKACAREGLVSLEVVAGDGTKLTPQASWPLTMPGNPPPAPLPRQPRGNTPLTATTSTNSPLRQRRQQPVQSHPTASSGPRALGKMRASTDRRYRARATGVDE